MTLSISNGWNVIYSHLIDADRNVCVKCGKTLIELVEHDNGCIRDTVEADFPSARRGQLAAGTFSNQDQKEEPSHGADPD